MNYFLLILLFMQNLPDNESVRRAFHFNVNESIESLDGYDIMEYYKGNIGFGTPDIPFSYNGVTYLFKNWENQEKFLADFKNLEPKYGGWCAYSMSQERIKTMPDNHIFKIIDKRLYLFKDQESMEKFVENFDELSAKAESNWMEIYKIIPDGDKFHLRNEIY